MDALTELTREIGVVVEAAGQHLRGEAPLTHDNLTYLRDTLNHSAETVQKIRDTLELQKS